MNFPCKNNTNNDPATSEQEQINQIANFFHAAIREIGRINCPKNVKVLDLGCGSGKLVNSLVSLGYDAYGCDIDPNSGSYSLYQVADRLLSISLEPYRLPYEDGSFKIILSTSVLEHAQNKEEMFREIYRLLEPGGISMHLFPAKWYLPVEPHIFVPLVNFLWPHCPKWWFQLWALLGIRNRFQYNKSWKEVAELNYQFCISGLSYYSNARLRDMSLNIFGNFYMPTEFYVTNSPGFAELFRMIPLKFFLGRLMNELRMAFIVQRKSDKNTST